MIVIRRGDRLDVPFLRSMLAHAYGRHVNIQDTSVPISRYVDNWGRRGDAALVAMDGGHSIGAAWYRLFTEASHGYGFVDEQTPELTVAVVPSRQDEGIAEQLLVALFARAAAEGYAGVSTSVEGDNPERERLREQGFEALAEHGSTLTLYRRLP